MTLAAPGYDGTLYNLLLLRYGAVSQTTGLRRLSLPIQRPHWSFDGARAFTERITSRYSETPTRLGTFIQPLGRVPNVIDVRLLYRPHLRPSPGTSFANDLKRLRALPGQPLHVVSRPLDYGDNWYMRDLVIEEDEILSMPDVRGQNPKIGGFFPYAVHVSFALFANRPTITQAV